jgi:hypothetical protein
VIKQFAANNIVINIGKINIMKFITKNSSQSSLHIGYKGKYIEETVRTEFLGSEIDNHINLKNHIEQMIPKLSGACYTGRLIAHISNSNTLIAHISNSNTLMAHISNSNTLMSHISNSNSNTLK